MEFRDSAEVLDYLVGLRKEFDFMNWSVILKGFHEQNPSTFHNGAFIFADGSIWWAR